MKSTTRFLLTAWLAGFLINSIPLESSEGSRQIHLDFHTAAEVGEIAAKFNKEQFKHALRIGHVNSINIFAKGHHGWSYYPTDVGSMHPGLNFDLMGQQIEACRELGIRVQLYFTVGWSAKDAKEHPEWAALRKDGSNDYRDQVARLEPEQPVRGWEYLAPEGPYAESIYEQVEEILSRYEVDGMWFDIIKPRVINYNDFSRAEMAKEGIDIDDAKAVELYNVGKYRNFLETMNALVAQKNPDASVYYNGLNAAYITADLKTFRHKLYAYNSKHDLEDLPTAWGGYDIFPYRSKYFLNTGKEIVAMSGKFHKAWGEFGGFKDKEAILYEAASMIAFGAGVNFGDQLHPAGFMDESTYENIGYAFDYVRKIEQYGIGGRSLARVGLYIGEDVPATEGLTRMLLEGQINFDVVNTLDDWSAFEVLILTSDGPLERDVQKINRFVNGGGKLLCMAEGVFQNGETRFPIGAKWVGDSRYDIDYTVVGEEISTEMVASPFKNYAAAIRVSPDSNTEVLASIREPYFSRQRDLYFSHDNTPFKLEAAPHPAAIQNGNVVYLAHDLDRQYHHEGARLHRTLFLNALDRLLTQPYVKVDLPSMGRINLLHQPDSSRYVLHLLYASPIQRGSVRVIEDLIPLFDTKVTLDLPKRITSATLIPGGKSLRMKREDGKVTLSVPEFTAHAAIVLKY